MLGLGSPGRDSGIAEWQAEWQNSSVLNHLSHIIFHLDPN
jgi:hypothetical protein